MLKIGTERGDYDAKKYLNFLYDDIKDKKLIFSILAQQIYLCILNFKKPIV